jgi:hypothetical protein
LNGAKKPKKAANPAAFFPGRLRGIDIHPIERKPAARQG